MLMECERGARYEHEIALLKGLEGAAGNVGEQRGCGAAAERDVAAMCLDATSGPGEVAEFSVGDWCQS